MGIGQSWATEENAPPVGPSLHIGNTRDRGKATDFWMFNPKRDRGNIGSIRCGQCKDVIPKEKRHCPHCWGEEE